jgi:hypothetical protein
MPRRITRGDVEAVFNAGGTGGRVIRVKKGETAVAAPVDFVGSHGAIRPFPDWDNRHFCAEDWHLIVVAGIDGGNASFRREQAEASANQVTFDFTLDGDLLATERTTIKPFLHPETIEVPEGEEKVERAFFFQEGRIMSPDDLSVGRHELLLTQTGPDPGQVEQFEITFFIDAPGTGACLID